MPRFDVLAQLRRRRGDGDRLVRRAHRFGARRRSGRSYSASSARCPRWACHVLDEARRFWNTATLVVRSAGVP
ncbi:hypothetical protein LT493_43510 [Streptomyces tricolor]|nr:hypothetical protein [Streptomyces tricolor]